MIIRCTGLTSKVSITEVSDVTPQAHARTARLSHTTLQQLLHEKGALVGYDLLGLTLVKVNLVAVLVNNVRHKYGLMMHAVVGHGAVGIG